MDVVAARDHLAGHLAVVRLPRVPEAGRAEPGNEEQRGQQRKSDGEPPFGGERREPAQPGDLADEGGERVAPVAFRAGGLGLRLVGHSRLRARHRRKGP